MSAKSIEYPVRVLHPITRLIVGGAQENTISTAILLDPDRFQVSILSGVQTGSEGSLLSEARDHDIPLILVPELVRQINPRLDRLALIKMTQMMRSGRYRIVHSHSSKAGILGRYAARRAGVPVIIHTIHGWSFHERMSPVARWMYVWLERWAASFSDALIVVSRHDQAKGLALGIGHPQQYHLIRSAIPFDEFDPNLYDGRQVRRELGIPEEAVVIGSVGRFSDQKNPLDWINVASLVAEEYPEAFFLMVGDGPLRADVEAALSLERLGGRVILTGIKRDIARLFSCIDIYLSTSLWEGMPRTVLQAMRMNLPVIAYKIDGLPEIVKHELNGYLCPPQDLAQMAVYCGYLVENEVQRREMGKRSRELAGEEFSLPKMIKQLESLYLSLIESKN